MNQPVIRVLLVEDSLIALTILKRILDSSPEIEVVGTAPNGREALELIPKLQPRVICTDLYMKEMDGLEFTRQVMAKFPCPILVISAAVQKENTQNIFRLLEAGAVDVFPKPSTGLASDYELAKRDLINKIKVLSGVAVFTKRPQQPIASASPISSPVLGTKRTFTPASPYRVVAIGASTGGPQALSTILTQLPANFPMPIICTQHISEGFLQGLVDWLGSECALSTKIAQPGESPVPGNIYFAPERRHLELDAQGRFTYASTDLVDGHRPSATVMLRAVARFYSRAAIGVLLTGMGRDGASGIQAIAQAGGLTIAQDEASCVVFGMPREAIALNAVHYVLPPEEIVQLLLGKNDLQLKRKSP
ncbi:MAG: chemotaxis-specific protein-glutamate methyltransferase CheB [Leptolyngbyaceae bacterium]|nr:chemotaxis-specific protein-glutamate methyltransferase CheB [Leptolyngbyaceae bacterium]